jgi:hypothetical protein
MGVNPNRYWDCPKCGERNVSTRNACRGCAFRRREPEQPPCPRCGAGPFPSLRAWPIHKCEQKASVDISSVDHNGLETTDNAPNVGQGD